MDGLYISGTRFVSARRASQITGYAADYLGQLCRAGKLHGKLVGRNWYINETAALDHRKRYKRNSENLISNTSFKRGESEFLRYETDRRSLIPDLDKPQSFAQDFGQEEQRNRGFLKYESGPTEQEVDVETTFVPVVVKKSRISEEGRLNLVKAHGGVVQQAKSPPRERSHLWLWKLAIGGIFALIAALVWGTGLFLIGVQYYEVSAEGVLSARAQSGFQLATLSGVYEELAEFSRQYLPKK